MNPQQLELESDRALYCYQKLFTFAFTLDFICTLASPNPLCGQEYRKVLEFHDREEKKIEVEKTVQLSYYFQSLKIPINKLTRDKYN